MWDGTVVKSSANLQRYALITMQSANFVNLQTRTPILGKNVYDWLLFDCTPSLLLNIVDTLYWVYSYVWTDQRIWRGFIFRQFSLANEVSTGGASLHFSLPHYPSCTSWVGESGVIWATPSIRPKKQEIICLWLILFGHIAKTFYTMLH